MEAELSNVERALRLKALGIDFYKASKYADAIEQYTKAIALNGKDVRLYLNKAVAHLELNQFADCIRQGELAIEIGRETEASSFLIAKAHYRIGQAYLRMNELDKAEFFFRVSFELNKNNESLARRVEIEKIINKQKGMFYRKLAFDWENLGKYQLAIDQYDQAIKWDSKNPSYFYHRANNYYKLQKFGEAVNDCKTASKLEPNCKEARLLSAKALREGIRSGKIEVELTTIERRTNTNSNQMAPVAASIAFKIVRDSN